MAFSRTGKLVLLGLSAATMLAVLLLNIQESQTIVVSAGQKAPALQAVSATVASTLQAPRYTGRTDQGTWELTAASARQLVEANSVMPNDAQQGEISLTTIAARWEPDDAPVLALQAQAAMFTPSTSLLVLPQGVAATGAIGAYQVMLVAQQGTANLASSTLNLTGGVSATLLPR